MPRKSRREIFSSPVTPYIINQTKISNRNLMERQEWCYAISIRAIVFQTIASIMHVTFLQRIVISTPSPVIFCSKLLVN